MTAGDNSPPGGGRVCGGLLLVHHEVQREELHRVLVSGLSQQPAGEGQLRTVSSWTTLQLTVNNIEILKFNSTVSCKEIESLNVS